jgi:putative addiction module component (TIGR02574 family)
MSALEILDQLRSMPAAERRQVVEKIWEEFGDRDLELTAEQANELDRRLAEHQATPGNVVSWEEIKRATDAKYRAS